MQKTIFSFTETQHPGIAFHGGVFALQCDAFLREHVKALVERKENINNVLKLGASFVLASKLEPNTR